MNGSLKAKNVLVGYINSGTFVKKCQSDWNEQDTDSLAYIQNKPVIITTEQLNAKQDKLTAQQLANLNEDHSKYLTAHQDISGKQDKLIAGENITISADGKTISASGGGGVGTVKSVNNAEPDANGNVKIDVSLLGVNVTPSLTDKYDLYYIDEEAEGYQVATQADINRVDADIANRVAKAQGVENAGKYLVVGADGNVTVANLPIYNGEVV